LSLGEVNLFLEMILGTKGKRASMQILICFYSQ
jgi:hypothetical protein